MCCMVKVAYLPNVWAWGLLQLAVSAYNNVQIQQSIWDVKTKSQSFFCFIGLQACTSKAGSFGINLMFFLL